MTTTRPSSAASSATVRNRGTLARLAHRILPLALTLPALAQVPPAPVEPVPVHGTHTPKHYLYETDAVFTNRFRMATLFSEYSATTGARTSMYLTNPDAQGYPMTLPSNTFARASCVGNAAQMPPGKWVCKWDGGGQVRFDTGNGGTIDNNGEIVRDVPAHKGNFLVEIRSLPVTNVRVYYEPYSPYLAGRGFDPDWKLRMIRLGVNSMRFLDSMEPNASIVQFAADRKPDNYYTESNMTSDQSEMLGQYPRRGCSWKFIADIAHELSLKRVAINVPRLTWLDTSNSWINGIVTYLLTALPADCRIEIEGSNEVWNSFAAMSIDTSFFQNAGVQGLTSGGVTLLTPRTIGTDYDKMCQAYAHWCNHIFTVARSAAGSQANRLDCTIGMQAVGHTNQHYIYRTRTGINSNVPIDYDYIKPSFYYGNEIEFHSIFTAGARNGTFQVGEAASNGLSGSSERRGIYRGTVAGKLVFERTYSHPPLLTGDTATGSISSASAQLVSGGDWSVFMPGWTPQDFHAYGQFDIQTRVFGPNGIDKLAQWAAADGANLLCYEGGRHEYFPNLSTTALKALYHWYRSPECSFLLVDLFERVRSIPTSAGHGYFYHSGGFPWGMWEDYLDDGGLRPGTNGMNDEAAYLAFEYAGWQLF